MFPFYLQAYQTFYSSIPNFCFRNTYSGPVISENKDDPRLVNCPYQTQYSKNYESLKNEYKVKITPKISFVALKNFLSSPPQSRNFLQTIYSFLCSLAFYELNNKRSYDQFSSEDWENFSKLFSPTTAGELSFLCKNIFKNNESKNTWTPKEDIELKKLILENNQKHLPWKKIAEKFNKALDLPNYKKPSQCSERWKNVLSKKCKKGEWTKGEDLIIISFVKKYGSKWSKLAKMIPDRTEHNIKNRFFSLISKQFEIPILRIKQSFNYLDPKILEEVKMSLND